MGYAVAMKLRAIASRLSIIALLLAATLACRMGGSDQKSDQKSSSSTTSSWKVGDRVDVEWNGTWWKGEILEARSGNMYKVHYTGWASSWDEVVTSARIRPLTAGSKRGTGR